MMNHCTLSHTTAYMCGVETARGQGLFHSAQVRESVWEQFKSGEFKGNTVESPVCLSSDYENANVKRTYIETDKISPSLLKSLLRLSSIEI